MTGLGDRLICLAAAWLYAGNTGRTLIADWRFGYLCPNNPSRNYSPNAFAECFRNRGLLAGVPFIGDGTVAQLEWPKPRYPVMWNSGDLQHRPNLRPASLMEGHRQAAVALIRAGQDLPEPVVVFDACINDGIVRFGDAHEFLRALLPVGSVAEDVESFRRQRFGDRSVIGLHIRRGNGGDIMGHTGFWNSFGDAIARSRGSVECEPCGRHHAAQKVPPPRARRTPLTFRSMARP